MDTVRWGIIGCGNVTELKSGPGLQKAEGSELVAVMRRNGEAAADYAKRHEVPKWYDDADKLINDPDVNAVYVATPPGNHCEYAIKAAEAGKPVYVEKPMSRHPEESRRMIEACKEAGVPLFVAYYRRCLPSFEKVKELVDAGAIGNILHANATLYWPLEDDDLRPDNLPWRVIPEQAGGGRLLDLGSHMLDYLDFLLGPVEEAKGHAVNQLGLYEPEDMITASLKFESGVLGACAWNFTCSPASAVDRCEILGTEGTIIFSFFSNTIVYLKTAEGTETFTYENPKHVQQPLIQTIVDELRGGQASPSPGESALRTDSVIEQILRDFRR